MSNKKYARQVLDKHLTWTNPELSLTKDTIWAILEANDLRENPNDLNRDIIVKRNGPLAMKIVDDIKSIEEGNYDSIHRYAYLIKLAEYVGEPITYSDVVLAKYENFLKNIRGTYSLLEKELKEKISLIEKEVYHSAK